ncbi:MAG TPA: acylphosphatase [Candidatus Dormibacteraeota bacterium]|jgi:acylphosphatase|nr:acylphosphatase [Candidatus Dormibacteraeota bacterium]
MPDELVRVRATARGRVQMVGYRAFVQRHAQDLDIRGEVRNLPDGSVESLMEGPREAVDRMVALMREGPYHAEVRAVDVRPEPAGHGSLPPMRVAS